MGTSTRHAAETTGRSTESIAIDPVRARLASSELESEFRSATAHSHGLQIIVGLTFLSMPLIVFATTDYLLLARDSRFGLLVALRAVVVLGAGYVIRLVRTRGSADAIDRALAAWWLALSVCVTAIAAARPSTYSLYVSMDVLFVLTAYVIPTRWTIQLFAGAALTIGPVGVLAACDTMLSTMQVALVVGSYVYANTLGVFLSHHLHASARSEFAARFGERHVRSTLNALTQFVPMCAGCKSVKDGGGRWHRVEEYVHAETGQDVTHGLCPSCVRELYPELADRILASEGASAE